jgi:hypothetical protein
VTTPPAPTCATDLLWWAFLGTLSILGFLLVLLLKKGIIERLDNMAADQKAFQLECHRCQEENRSTFVPRADYEKLLVARQQAHQVINDRLVSLEGGQKSIGDQIDIFHRDMTEKITRLTMSFVVRDAVLSTRVDNISGKIGVAWTRESEEKLIASLESKIADLKNGEKS